MNDLEWPRLVHISYNNPCVEGGGLPGQLRPGSVAMGQDRERYMGLGTQ